MEGGERAAAPPQRASGSGGAAGEFFICFTSRPSSLRALPSPGRKDKYREHGAAAPPSLSRRLKNSGSLKGGQSPATIPASSRRKSFPVEVAEPSSPKVTCIGQVKVKTARMKKKTKRKKKKKISSSTSCSPAQSWVHLPFSGFCEAVRTFGSELNCFSPCGGGRKETLVAAPPMTATESVVASTAAESVVASTAATAEEDEEEEEEKRESFCVVPPRNALLLMRCRSDPVKMAALTTRLCGSPTKVGVEDIERENDEDGEVAETPVAAAEENGGEEKPQRQFVEVQSKEDHEEGDRESKVEEEEPARSCLEREAPGEKVGEEEPARSHLERENRREKAGEEEPVRSCLVRESRREKVGRRHSFSTEKDVRRTSSAGEKEGRRRWSFSLEISRRQLAQTTLEPDFVTRKTKNLKSKKKTKSIEDSEAKSEIFGQSMAAPPEDSKAEELPDCLLLMMYEPKLSMEVSKETWVCSSDFLSHHRPRHRQKQPKAAAEPPPQPLPPAEEAAAAERKPAAPQFGLTRCKSEPMRSSAKMEPDACFWKNRHRPIGEAGIGF